MAFLVVLGKECILASAGNLRLGAGNGNLVTKLRTAQREGLHFS